MEVSFLPEAFLKVSVVNLKRSSSGPGPEARPPNVLSLAPEGRTFVVSQLGT